MKLVRKSLERDSSGGITLCAEEPQDMWHSYNLIAVGDQLRAPTIRRLTLETATGTTKSERVHVTLQIRVEKVDFDAEAGQLHINGRVVEENKHVKMGVFHTIDLELHRNFTILKKEWDSIVLALVAEACDPAAKAEIGAIVLHEGLANVCLITEHMTILRQRLETSIPKKRLGSSSNHDRGLDRFYDLVAQSMIRHFDFEKVKAVLVASPGFLGQGLMDYMFAKAVREDNKVLVKSKSKFVLVHCSTGHLHALQEVLKSPQVTTKLADTKFARETKALDRFFELLGNDEERAWYGEAHVSAAADRGAVGSLLISDSLFRSNNVGQRKKYVRMVEQVRSGGGEALIFSSMHETGKQLENIGGIAAILTFPLPELEELDD